VVTVIFLPLSFVTSFLGMNTADIRNMNTTQGLFWIIALPLTAITLSVIVFVAYSGDGLKERLTRIFSRKMRNQESYASRAMLSYSDRKEKSLRPELMDMMGSSVAGEPFERLFSWRTPVQPDPFIEGTYGRSQPSVGLSARLGRQSSTGTALGDRDTLSAYSPPSQTYPV
jgi:hypothetical protein